MKQDNIPDLSNLDDYSYENIFSVYERDGMYFYNLLNTITFPTEINPLLYSNYIVNGNLSWQLLSYKLYGTIKLWWVICAVNQIQNPLIIPPAGTTLKILTANAVAEVLKKLNITE
ncbi:MAG: hypothetical protein ABIO05_08865 [Ferruginibacter sp.]